MTLHDWTEYETKLEDGQTQRWLVREAGHFQAYILLGSSPIEVRIVEKPLNLVTFVLYSHVSLERTKKAAAGLLVTATPRSTSEIPNIG